MSRESVYLCLVTPSSTSTAYHRKSVQQRESDKNPNWRKKFVKTSPDSEITATHPEITIIQPSDKEDMQNLTRRLKTTIDKELKKDEETRPNWREQFKKIEEEVQKLTEVCA